MSVNMLKPQPFYLLIRNHKLSRKTGISGSKHFLVGATLYMNYTELRSTESLPKENRCVHKYLILFIMKCLYILISPCIYLLCMCIKKKASSNLPVIPISELKV